MGGDEPESTVMMTFNQGCCGIEVGRLENEFLFFLFFCLGCI